MKNLELEYYFISKNDLSKNEFYQYQIDKNGKKYQWYNNGISIPDEQKIFLKLQFKQDKKCGYRYNQYFHHWELKSLRSLDTIDEIKKQHINYENSGFKFIESIHLDKDDCRFLGITSGELLIYRSENNDDYIPTDPIGMCFGYLSGNKELIQLKVYH